MPNQGQLATARVFYCTVRELADRWDWLASNYPRLCQHFEQADTRYNSGIFHFKPEKDRHEPPDELTLGFEVDDALLRDLHARPPDSFNAGHPLPPKPTVLEAIAATDTQIDRLVYQLYGLTDEEIKTVKGLAK